MRLSTATSAIAAALAILVRVMGAQSDAAVFAHRDLGLVPILYDVIATPIVTIPIDRSRYALDVRSAIRLRDGRVVMTDRASSANAPIARFDLVYFDSAGKQLERVPLGPDGPLGEGVSEIYEMPNGDVLVSSNRGGWWVYGARGIRRFSAMTGGMSARGAFSDGSILVATQAIAKRWSVGSSSFAMDSSAYSRVDPKTGQRRSLPFFNERPLIDPPLDRTPFPVHGAWTAGVGRDVVWITDMEHWSAEAYDGTGKRLASFFPPPHKRLLTATRDSAYPLDSALSANMLVDDAGQLWMEAGTTMWFPFGRAQPHEWYVVDPRSGLRGSVTMPPGFQLVQVAGKIAVGYLSGAFVLLRMR